MKEQIKIDFDKIVKTSGFSENDLKLKRQYLNKFIENGFPNRKLENWKFSDINQVIQKNIDNTVLDYKVFFTVQLSLKKSFSGKILSQNDLKEMLNLSVKYLNEQNKKEIKILDMRQKNQVVVNG